MYAFVPRIFQSVSGNNNKKNGWQIVTGEPDGVMLTPVAAPFLLKLQFRSALKANVCQSQEEHEKGRRKRKQS